MKIATGALLLKPANRGQGREIFERKVAEN
jgi:hypothetical protein